MVIALSLGVAGLAQAYAFYIARCVEDHWHGLERQTKREAEADAAEHRKKQPKHHVRIDEQDNQVPGLW